MTRTCFYERFSLLLILLTLALLPVLATGAWQSVAHKQTDILNWLPDDCAETREYQWFRKYFETDQFIIVSWDGCTLDDVRLKRFASQLQSPSGSGPTESGWFSSVTTGGELIERIVSGADERRPISRQEAIDRLRGFFIGPDGRQTCAVVSLSRRAEQDLRGTIAHLYRVAERVCELPRHEVHLGGGPVVAQAVNEQGETALLGLAALSSVVALFIAWRCLGAWRLVVLVFFVSACSSMTSLAIVWFCGSAVDVITLTMPPLVYVLALSGAIHLVNYYKAALTDKEGVRRAATRAISRGWLPCALAAGTTSLAMLSLATSTLQPVRKFGLFSAIGVLATLVFLFGFLPACLARMTRNGAAQVFIIPPAAEPSTKRRSVDYPEACFGQCHGAGAGCGLCSGAHAQATLDVIGLFSSRSKIVRDYIWLERRLGPLLPLEVVIRIAPERKTPEQEGLNFLQRLELAQQVHDAMIELEEVGSVTSPAVFLPDVPQGAQHWLRRSVISRQLERQRDRWIAIGQLADETRQERKTELWRITARAWSLRNPDKSAIVNAIRRRVDPIVNECRSDHLEGISVVYTGSLPLFCESQRQLMASLVHSLALAFVLIAIVMVLLLRSFTAGMVAMLPNAFPVIVVFGTMGLLGIKVDLGSMLTASVAMGVAVDDTVHYLTWFRRGCQLGMNRFEATWHAYRSCATAMFQTTAVAGLGLLVLSLSSFTPTHRFGLLMFSILAVALVGDLVLLPAMLCGPLGNWFGKRKRDVE